MSTLCCWKIIFKYGKNLPVWKLYFNKVKRLGTFVLPFHNDMGRMTSCLANGTDYPSNELSKKYHCGLAVFVYFRNWPLVFTAMISSLYIVPFGFDGSVHALH